MQRPYTALLISRAFPPASNIGVYRVVGLSRHLVDRGWRVTVITSAPAQSAPVDPELLKMVPETVRVVQTRAPDLPLLAARVFKGRTAGSDPPPARSGPSGSNAASSHGRWYIGSIGSHVRRAVRLPVDWLSWWLHIPDSQTGWLLPAVRAGLKEARHTRPDVIFSTAPVWTSHLVAAVISKVLGIPLVADFRDPWAGSTFFGIPYGAHRRVNSWLERMVVARATRITCAWDGIRQHLVANYPSRARDVSTIINGFDPDLIDRAVTRRLEANGQLFLHAGTFYGPRSPIPLLTALQQIRTAGDALRGQVTFALIGSPAYNGQSMESLIHQYGVADYVRAMPRLPHQHVLGALKGADAAMLFGQSGADSLASVPAKAFEYIGTGKPVLAIGAGSEVCELMRRGGCPVWDAPADSPARIALAVHDMVRYLQQGQRDDQSTLDARSQFARGCMAARLEQVLHEARVSRCSGGLAESVSAWGDGRQ
jgi:glycosyltransferase involved in cell wall biosynthesis